MTTAQTLRDYQSAALDQLRALIRAGKHRLLLVAPTGSGKTTIAAAMIAGAVARGGAVVFLAHRKELIDQCSARLDGAGIDHGIVMANHPRARPELPVQVASVATLVRRLDRLPKATIIIVDEAHHARAKSYGSILDAYPGAVVVGLSATPWRGDGKGLKALFDDVVIASTPRALIDLGFLVPFDGFGYENPALEDVGTVAGDYDELELAEKMNTTTLVGGIVEQWRLHAGGARTVAFAVNVKHSKAIVAEFVSAGVAAEHLDGTMAKDQREGILSRLKTGETRVVSNCAVLTEGWDLPECEVCILARPTKSTVIYLQQAGRVLRPAPGKDRARIHDHAGCMLHHGLPDEDRDYSLESDTKKNAKHLTGYQQCPECFRICSTQDARCPGCLHVFEEPPAADFEEEQEIEYIAGPQLTIDEIRRLRGASQGDKAAEYKRLLGVAERKGYARGWAAHQYRTTFNVWPRFPAGLLESVTAAPEPPISLDRLRLLAAGGLR